MGNSGVANGTSIQPIAPHAAGVISSLESGEIARAPK
jgi:hypothetical protein